MAPFGSFPFGGRPFGGGPAGPGVPGPPPPIPPGPDGPYVLQIGPVTDAIKYLFFNTFRISKQANGRDTLTCTLVVNDGFLPVRGQAFTLTFGLERLFAGYIFSRQSRFYDHPTTGYLTIDLTCVDWNALADRRLIGEVYENVRLGDIYRDIVRRTLAAEGITADGVLDGPMVSNVRFTNVTVAQAFDTLYEITGHYWNIDYYKVLHTGPRGLAYAPFGLDVGVNSVLHDFTDVETLAQYRNSQMIEGGQGITQLRIESFPGDGETRTWNVEYPIYDTPILDIDGVPIDPAQVGIRGIDDNKRFYWGKGDTAIGQDRNDPVIPKTDVLHVTYQGLFKILSQSVDPVAVAERQAVEGGSGLYESIEQKTDLNGAEVVQQRAIGLLKRYSLGSDVDIETDRDGLAVGQQVPVTISQMGISAVVYLIMSMETIGLLPTTRRYRVRATTGELRGSFAEFWKRVFARNPIVNSETTTLEQLLYFRESLEIDASVSVTLSDPVSDEWGTALWGESEWG